MYLVCAGQEYLRQILHPLGAVLPNAALFRQWRCSLTWILLIFLRWLPALVLLAGALLGLLMPGSFLG